MKTFMQGAKTLLFAVVGLTDTVAHAAERNVKALSKRGEAAWQQAADSLNLNKKKCKQPDPACLKKLMENPMADQMLHKAISDLTQDQKQLLADTLQQAKNL